MPVYAQDSSEKKPTINEILLNKIEGLNLSEALKEKSFYIL